MSRTYHFDGLGSTVALTDETGAVTDRYTYDEWGNVTPDPTNQTLDNPYQYVGRYGYYTHYQEPEFGLLQLGVRYYDPSIGRFTQVDPARDGLEWYDYVFANPLIAVDPYGLDGWNRGQMFVTNSCKEVLGFLRYVPEDNDKRKMRLRPKADKWYAVDAGFCCRKRYVEQSENP